MNQKAFTLIETIIYASLLSLVLGAFVSLSVFLNEIKNKNYLIGEVNANGALLLSKISDYVRMADSIDAPTFGQSSAYLTLKMPDTTKNTVFLQDGVVILNENGSEFNLSSGKVKVSDLNFQNFSSAGNNDIIEISFRISNKEGEGAYFEYEDDFRTAISLRR